MPSIEVSKADQDDVLAPAAAKPIIGIIYPPPEVRNIVDKTASFVARNGPEFETRIRQNELNNPKFNFLAPGDPYYAYYKHKVKEFQEGRGLEPTAVKSGLGYMLQKAQAPEQVKAAIEVQVPREPPSEFEFSADPPSISAFDLDMVKLTAQFVARNGRQFLTNLMKMEARNYQFDFLRPQHSLFNYFTKLVEQYTKILIPPKDLIPKLRKEADSYKVVLDQARYRMEWAKHQERERKREEEEKEKERVAYAQIDWHDFVVVETVDYQSSESGNLPPPTTPDEVGARMLLQQRFEDGLPAAVDDVEPENDLLGIEIENEEEDEEEFDEEDEVVTRGATMAVPVVIAPVSFPLPTAVVVSADTRVQDMDEESETESGDEAADRNDEKLSRHDTIVPPPPPPPVPKDLGPKLPPLPPNPDHVIIRKDYNPKVPKSSEQTVMADKFLISPITGEQIPADKIQEHMRIGLLDPKWIEQRDRAIAERREQEEVYAQGSAIGDQLKHLAERRTDIFGSGAEETQIGKKIGEEEKKEKTKVIWDGHSASMEKVSQKARENITIEDQIAVIHKVKGLLPDEDKEKIGPAMPKLQTTFPAPLAPLTKPAVPVEIQPPASSVSVPPQPLSVTSSSASVAHLQSIQAHSVRPPIATVPPVPPQMPVVGMSVPMQPGMIMIPHTTQQNPASLGQGVLGARPPLVSVIPIPVVRPPFMPGLPVVQPVTSSIRPNVQSSSRPADSANDDEPLAKRTKTEEQLVPENEFLALNKGPVTFRVQVPNSMDKSEWKLNGQLFTITLPLTDTVSVIKAKMFDELGMPAGKQKLQLEGMFMKDSNTLAYYNFTPMCVVHLQVKERGGRKK
jgi:splicing factor 3A subunit 1